MTRPAVAAPAQRANNCVAFALYGLSGAHVCDNNTANGALTRRRSQQCRQQQMHHHHSAALLAAASKSGSSSVAAAAQLMHCTSGRSGATRPACAS
jgi:hypothetical protein